jgi:hypothetical protein
VTAVTDKVIVFFSWQVSGYVQCTKVISQFFTKKFRVKNKFSIFFRFRLQIIRKQGTGTEWVDSHQAFFRLDEAKKLVYC